MSKFGVPSDAKLHRGAMGNRAVLAALAKPLPGFESLCTEAAIKAERPVIVVYQYGYISCTAFDVENEFVELRCGGELVEYRPLEPGDEWHPSRIQYVYTAALPRVNRGSDKPTRVSRKPKAKPPTATATPDGDADELASDLGLI